MTMMLTDAMAASAAGRCRLFAASIRVLLTTFLWMSSAWTYCATAEEPPSTTPQVGSERSASDARDVSSSHEFRHGEWPFRPLERPSVPELRRLGAWAVNPIDRFIGQKLEAANLEPSSVEAKRNLLRRVTFDLTGMPPTPAEQIDFLADQSSGAYAKVVDRLLSSPRYGEHWAQHWLDLVRFSETEGFKKDGLRPDAYKYRDYVIRAFNDDLPYDRFVRQQLAGDELEPDNPNALIATGLLRLYPEDVNASNLVQQRQEILDDITENTGLVFMGLTVGCARCHDHKFDDIKQKDYYRLQACFAAILPRDNASIATPQQVDEYQKRMADWERATKPIRDAIDTELVDERQQALQDAIAAYDPETLAAIHTPPERRTCLQEQLVAEAEEWIDSRLNRAYRRCGPEERKLYDQQMEQLAKFDSQKPEQLPTAMAISDGDDQAPPTCVLASGNYLKPAAEVTPGFPEFLGESEPQITPPAGRPDSTGRRSALAKWLTRPDHPLTARVIVNRLWHYHFGQGIVATPNDFGAMGGNPSHPELLDWLASELVADGWHLKPIQRLMVLSATYCQSSRVNPSSASHAAALAVDAADNLVWHARRQRLEGEELRDSELEVAGELSPRMYGPSAQPELPAVLAESRYAWDADQQAADRNRRSIYVLAKRNMRLPMFASFDQPDMQNSCPRRMCTTTAPQALELLNGDLTEDVARHWSGKLLEDCSGDEEKVVREAYSEAYGRPPQADEVKSAEEFVDKDSAEIAAEPTPPDERQLPVPTPPKLSRAKAAAIVDFCHALLCSNEFLYLD